MFVFLVGGVGWLLGSVVRFGLGWVGVVGGLWRWGGGGFGLRVV